MRVLLTVATLSGAISGSAALLPVVASDFISVNGAESIDPLDLVVEPQARELQATLSAAEVKPVVAPPAAELPQPKLKVVPEVVKVITIQNGVEDAQVFNDTWRDRLVRRIMNRAIADPDSDGQLLMNSLAAAKNKLETCAHEGLWGTLSLRPWMTKQQFGRCRCCNRQIQTFIFL